MTREAFAFGDPDVRSDLKDMCCPPMQFMWDNHLLAPRAETKRRAKTWPPKD